MPELPEVERVRQTLARVLVGKKIVDAEFVNDDIMMFGVPAEAFQAAVKGQTVKDVHRKGKYWWIVFEDGGFLAGHLGMSGWIRELGADTIRLREHGNAPLEDEEGRPRFLKMLLTAEDGRRVAFTDGRRLGRLWLTRDPKTDERIKKLGFDVRDELPSATELYKILSRRKAPIKALLLDQGLFAGIGNWIADEVLYQAGIAPKRLGSSLSAKEVLLLHDAIVLVIKHSVDVDADKEQFPKDWLFHVRWGGKSGDETISGEPIVREPVGGRTTAWVPSRQK